MLSDALKRAFFPRPVQVLAAMAACSAVLLLVWFAAVKSDAYEFADGFVARDERITSVTGQQSERSLRWFKGFSMSYGDNDGEASLTLRVQGDRGNFDVPIALKKSQGRWNVINAKAVNDKGETVVIVE